MLIKDSNTPSVDSTEAGDQLPLYERRNLVRRNLRLGLVVLIVIVVGAMLLGIFSGNSNNAQSLVAVSNNSNQPVKGLGASNNASGVNYAAATTAAMTYAAMTSAAAMTAPAAVNGSVANNSSANTTSDNNSNNQVVNPAQDDRMIIRNGSIAITVNDVEAALGRITAIANGKGGLVFSTNTDRRGDYTYATLTLQIPPAKFDETISDIHSVAVTVTNETSTSQDVTEEYVDNDAQIKNLTQTEQQLNTLLTKATTVGDVLAVQREVTTVRGQIDRLTGRQKYLSSRSSMSSLTVSIAPIIAPPSDKTPPIAQGWDFGRTLQNAWDGSVRGLQGLATALITIAVYVWIVPLLLLGLWLVYKLYRVTLRNLNPSYNQPSAGQQPPTV